MLAAPFFKFTRDTYEKIAKFTEDGKIEPAINQLNAFIAEVEEDYSAGSITQTIRDNFVGLAQALLDDSQP